MLDLLRQTVIKVRDETTDPEVRKKAEEALKELDSKYPEGLIPPLPVGEGISSLGGIGDRVIIKVQRGVKV